MHPAKRTVLWINLVGGVAVLGSYAWGIATHAGNAGAVWGGVPEWLKPTYTVSMLLAAVGYLVFTSFFLFGVDAARARVGRRGFATLDWIYVAILAPSALWMPLTFVMLDRPSPSLWLAIRLVLALVGLGSLAMLGALLRWHPRQPALWHALSVLGAVAFCVQTALLDALVWPAYFPFP